MLSGFFPLLQVIGGFVKSASVLGIHGGGIRQLIRGLLVQGKVSPVSESGVLLIFSS